MIVQMRKAPVQIGSPRAKQSPQTRRRRKLQLKAVSNTLKIFGQRPKRCWSRRWGNSRTWPDPRLGRWIWSDLIAVASNIEAMASTLLAMASSLDGDNCCDNSVHLSSRHRRRAFSFSLL